MSQENAGMADLQHEEDPSLRTRKAPKTTTFRTQANALFRKNGAQQRRALCTNIFIILTPIFFCLLLFVLQWLINKALDTPDNKCGCVCSTCCSTPEGGVRTCRDATPDAPCGTWEDCDLYDENQCGFQYSAARQASFCPIPSPSIWPALIQVPSPGYLAHPYSPEAAMLITGDNEALLNQMNLFPVPAGAPNAASAAQFAALGQENGAVYAGALSLLGGYLGTYQKYPILNEFIDPGFVRDDDYNGTLSFITSDPTAPESIAAFAAMTTALAQATADANATELSLVPLAARQVWLPSVDDVNRALYCGYKAARCVNGTSQINAYTNAWDFGSTNADAGVYDMRLWYNATGRYAGDGNQPTQLSRVHGAFNAATNAFLRFALGPQAVSAKLVGVMAMPKPGTKLTLDIASLIGTLFYTWLLQLLLPVMLATLVAEKEGRLRTMMKMHGLDDGAYWAIQYLWYFVLNMVYTWVLIGVGSAIGLAFFTRTDYSFQFVFYLLWICCLVSFTFLMSSLFRSTRTAVVVAFLYVFGTGLVGYLLLQSFVAAGHWWVIFFEIIPGFGLYRGLYEIAQYAFRAAYQGTQGITWSKVSDDNNGLIGVMVIFAVESVVFLLMAWYFEKVMPNGVGVPRHPLFFLGKKYHSDAAAVASDPITSSSSIKNISSSATVNGSAGSAGVVNGAAGDSANGLGAANGAVAANGAIVGTVVNTNGNHQEVSISEIDARGSVGVSMEPEDVAAERLRSAALTSGSDDAAIVIRNLHKVFPGKVKKIAVRDLAMAVARGECFGLLGPNGAGKSTTLNILTGFLTPTAGTATVEGYDIVSDMDQVYHLMGVCPQDNLLWPRLTAREHLMFYGRLKNLSGAELAAAVDAALRSVNLLNGGVADREVRAYSGGMKRRLSVAISLIGDPSVVYLDEPSTGLDPASRQNLWDVVKAAKPGRGIILTTHSMEEAAVLCDRLGIFVDGQLVCVGAPKELTARYGGYLVFTVTTPVGGEEAADALAQRLSTRARLTYSLAGTRRYELPTEDVTLAEVFALMEETTAAGKIEVLDWGVANATLEEVFIKFAKELGVEGGN